MAHEPGPRNARGDGRAGPACAAGLAAVDGVAPDDLGAWPPATFLQSGDAGRCLLGDDRRPLVFADIAARRRDLPERSLPPGQETYLAALLAPLCGTDAPGQAAALLARFGSIAGVAGARKRELAEVFGAESPLPAHIAAVRRLLQAGLREHVVRQPLDPADPGLLVFVVAHFSGLKHEEMLALFADADGRFLDHQILAAGPSRRMEFAPSLLFRRAVALGAAQVVLAHNHPSGAAAPSKDDLASTRRIVHDGQLLGIALRDHLIVGGNTVFSMRRAGLL